MNSKAGVEFSPEELEILINKAKIGDKGAFEVLYTNLYTPLFRFVRSRIRDEEKAVDICQEVFLKWYNSLSTYEIKMKPLSYLMMISMRLIINESKKKKSISLPEGAEEYIADEAESIENILDFKVEIDKIKVLFEELNEDQLNVITMRYIADADTETIAEAIDTSIVNVRQIEHRALAKLRKLYIQKYES
jgi:RNA polymerase sigma-70 factor (ECF subfamily)